MNRGASARTLVFICLVRNEKRTLPRQPAFANAFGRSSIHKCTSPPAGQPAAGGGTDCRRRGHGIQRRGAHFQGVKEAFKREDFDLLNEFETCQTTGGPRTPAQNGGTVGHYPCVWYIRHTPRCGSADHLTVAFVRVYIVPMTGVFTTCARTTAKHRPTWYVRVVRSRVVSLPVLHCVGCTCYKPSCSENCSVVPPRCRHVRGVHACAPRRRALCELRARHVPAVSGAHAAGRTRGWCCMRAARGAVGALPLRSVGVNSNRVRLRWCSGRRSSRYITQGM